MSEWLYENGNLWGVWLFSAENLLRAAGALKQHKEHFWGVEVMLWGNAFEDLLKSWYLKSGKCLYDENGKFLRNTAASRHDLAGMAKLFGYHLDSSYHNMVTRLTKYVRWAGRYPFAFSEEESSVFWSPLDQELLESLIESLLADLKHDIGERVVIVKHCS